VRYAECHEEYLLAFSCKTRELCPSCGGQMMVVAFIVEHEIVDRILRHLERKDERRERAPPS